MKLHMFKRTIKDKQVLRFIVSFVKIYMMNYLVRFKKSMKTLFAYKSMFKNASVYISRVVRTIYYYITFFSKSFSAFPVRIVCSRFRNAYTSSVFFRKFFTSGSYAHFFSRLFRVLITCTSSSLTSCGTINSTRFRLMNSKRFIAYRADLINLSFLLRDIVTFIRTKLRFVFSVWFNHIRFTTYSTSIFYHSNITITNIALVVKGKIQGGVPSAQQLK